MMAYVTYFTNATPGLPAGSALRPVARVFPTQGEATQGGAADGETTWHRSVDDDVKPGWWLVTGAGAGAGSVSEGLPANTLSNDTVRKRAAARRVHAALQGWTSALAVEGVTHPAAIVAVGHDFLFRAHQACYLVFKHGAYTVAQLESWAGEMAKGAADVTSPATFFARMEGGGSPIAAPTAPTAWVKFTAHSNTATAVRVNLADAVTASGSRRTGGGEGNLDLDASDLPADGLTADGGWIETL